MDEKKHLINDKIMHTQWIQMKHIGLKGFLTYAESALELAPYQNVGFGMNRTFQIKSNNNNNIILIVIKILQHHYFYSFINILVPV